MISIEQLRVVIAITEENSVKAAAYKLHKTQPALSHSLKQLENQLAITIFERDKYRLSLTSAGKTIYQMAKRALRSVNDIEQYASHLKQGNEKEVVIAIEAAFPLEKLLPALESTQREFPQTQITLKQEYLSGALMKALKGDAHIAITAVPAGVMAKHEEMITSVIEKGGMINVAAPKMLARYSRLTHSEQLINENQVIVKDTGDATGDSELNTQAAQRRWYVNSFDSKLSLIEQGMGWGMLPEHLVANKLVSGELEEIKLEDSESRIHFPFYLVRSKEYQLGPISTKLWEKLLKIK